MTFTTVHKDYVAPTLGEAAEAMLRDTEVWQVSDKAPVGEGGSEGIGAGYQLHRWEWITTDGETRLRAHFR